MASTKGTLASAKGALTKKEMPTNEKVEPRVTSDKTSDNTPNNTPEQQQRTFQQQQQASKSEAIRDAERKLENARAELKELVTAKRRIFHRIGRLIRGSSITVLSLAGVAVYATVAGDILYIGLDSVGDMDLLQEKYKKDIERLYRKAARKR